MQSVLDRVDTELSGLVEDIAAYNSIEDRAERIIALDSETMAALAALKQHYAACRRLETLRHESQQLDKTIEQTLVGLAECRKQLEIGPDLEPAGKVSVTEVLNYATKITKFTHKQPGSENILPWPTEDGIRRGLLAQLVSGEQPQQEEEVVDEVMEEQVVHAAPQQQGQPQKISLDLFDSDEE